MFFTILHYDGKGFLSRWIYRAGWSMIRVLTRIFPDRMREFLLSIGGPLMIPATVVSWLSLVTVGYACIFLAALNPPASVNIFEGAGSHTWLDALYLSGSSISTQGYGDMTPQLPGYGVLAFSEALLGFVIITLALSYIINIYNVIKELVTLAAELYHRAGDSGRSARAVLLPYILQQRSSELEELLGSIHGSLLSYHEGVRRYPVVYYFYSRDAYRALPRVFDVIGVLIEHVRFATAHDDRTSHSPNAITLEKGYRMIARAIHNEFNVGPLPEAPEPQPFDRFREQYFQEHDERLADPAIAEFLEMHEWTAHAREAASGNTDAYERSPVDDPTRAYLNYREWLAFSHIRCCFVERTARDLGYDPAQMRSQSA